MSEHVWYFADYDAIIIITYEWHMDLFENGLTYDFYLGEL
jgi:hypothetical protein